MPLKIALTGATGFVGRAVVLALVAGNHRVSALVRNVSKADLPAQVRVVQGDLQNMAALDDLTRDADVLVHVAGVISALTRQDYFAANEQGMLDLARSAMRNGVKRLVHISSLSAREPQLSAYGASKQAGEKALAGFADKLSIMILRPPAVYGPGDRATLPLMRSLTQAIALIPGRGSARFSLIYVGDLARIIVEAASSIRTGMLELDDGHRQGYDWAELLAIAGASEQKSITPLFMPKPALQAVAYVAEGFARMRGKPSMISCDKINELYHENWVAAGEGWPLKNPVGFAQGFSETLGWYRHAGWLPQRHGAIKSPSVVM